MARFFNPKALRGGVGNLPVKAPVSGVAKPEVVAKSGTPVKTRPTNRDSATAAVAVQQPPVDSVKQERAEAEPRPLMVTIGNIALFLYLISGELNDLSHHFIGVNAYVSWIAQILIGIALLTSGAVLKAWKQPVGKLWIALLILMIGSIPGSEWPGHSFSSVVDYFFRSTLIFFAACAFVVDASTLKTAILGEVVNGILLLISCVTMGGTAEGGDRLVLVDSYFYGGANDLAVGLVIAIGFFLYWTVQRNIFKVIVGGASLLAATYFLMKTGSRGGFLALAILFAGSLIFSGKYRLRLLPMVLLAPLMFLFVPSDLVHRLSYIVLDTENTQASTEDESTSLASQQERTYMFWRSVHLMGAYPI
jgi:hypothetical protein